MQKIKYEEPKLTAFSGIEVEGVPCSDGSGNEWAGGCVGGTGEGGCSNGQSATWDCDTVGTSASCSTGTDF